MKKSKMIWIGIVLAVAIVLLFISGCAEEKDSISETDSTQPPPQEIQEIQQPTPASSEEKPTTPIEEDQAIVPESPEISQQKTQSSDDTINLNDKASLPVLHNLGINIEKYNPSTKMAGDFEFIDTSDNYKHKIFLEFGIKLEGLSGSSVLPSYNYVLPLGTKVFSPVNGTIETVRYQERDNDYEVNIVPDGFPKWRVSLDHVINLKVQEGDKIQPGDIVGEPTPRDSFESKRGFVELQVWKATRQAPLGVCPFLLLDEALKDNIKVKIDQLAQDWENFLGRNVYDEDLWIAPGCLSETEVT